jgi:hypothetical protein
MEQEKEIVTYDYKTIKIRREMESITTDAYNNLGWELTGSSVADGMIFHTNLSFKRNRKIANKTELLRKQEKVDGILCDIEVLQNSKKHAGLIGGITVGTIGALTFGGGMAMVMELGGTFGFVVGGIALGVVGIGICLLGWLVGVKVKKSKVNKITPILESEYDKLADTCER